MFKQGIFLVFAAFLTCSCTTLKSHEQRLKLASDPEGASVYLDNKLLGHTPGYIAIPRQKNATLRIEKKGYPTIYKKLETSYRWGDSFFSDFIWLIYGAPLAWTIDYLSGSVWDYDKVGVIALGSKKEIEPLRPPELIAISPPQNESELLSNEAAQRLYALSVVRFNESHVEDFNDTHNLFAEYGWDNGLKTSPGYRDDLYNDLNITHMINSTVSVKKDEIVIDSKLMDVFTDKEVGSFQDKVPASSFKYKDTGVWSSTFNYLFSIFPNTISFDFATPAATIYTSDNYTFQGAGETTSSAIGIINGIGIKSLDSPVFQRGISGVIKLIPVITLSYNRYNLTAISGPNFTSNYNFDWATIVAGFGPEAGLVTAIGYFYTELAPALAMNWITASANNGQDTSARGTSLSLFGEIGYEIFASSRINIRLFTRFQSIPTDPWTQVLTQIRGQETPVQTVTQTVAGLSLGYYFPEDRIILKRAFFSY